MRNNESPLPGLNYSSYRMFCPSVAAPRQMPKSAKDVVLGYFNAVKSWTTKYINKRESNGKICTQSNILCLQLLYALYTTYTCTFNSV